MAAPARGGARSAAGARAAERAVPAGRRVRRGPKRLAVPSGTPRVQVEEIQRSRLLAAAAAVIDELGYEQTSVALITARARVSRRTFYELFGNREACLVALLEEVVGRLEQELGAAGLEGLEWRERVRGGLWTILSFLDAEPVLARVCVVQALHGGASAVVCLVRSGACVEPRRHYEMVSPVYKGGFPASSIDAVAPDGESMSFYSPGAFAGAPASAHQLDYLARRTASGWSTEPLMPPAGLIANLEQVDVSPLLGTVFASGHPGASYESFSHSEISVLLHSTGLPDDESGWEHIGTLDFGESPREVDADPSFCHVILDSDERLYELNRGCGGEASSLTQVGVNNQGGPINPRCEVRVGDEGYAFNGPNTFNAISVDGSEIFFTDCLSGETLATSPNQLFVRLGGTRVVEVSKPLTEACSEVPCPGAPARGSAEFDGASEDGSRVFFTAPLVSGPPPLVPGDTDASNNLYMASVGCPEGDPGCSGARREVTGLSEVSHDPNGGPAEVQGVLRVAPDGGRVYFVAGGDLLSGAERQALEGEGHPVPHVGADNLYVYDAGSRSIAFIAELCSNRELSGSVEDTGCPSRLNGVFRNVGELNDMKLWSSDESESQTAGPEGRFLVFTTYARLTADDRNAAADVYRYDALTGSLERVSTGEGSYDANGNGGVLGSSITPGNHGVSGAGSPVRSQYEMETRAVSEDGSRIVFVSAEPLSPMAGNGLTNVYEWHEAPGGSGGSVSLVSSGEGVEPVEDVVISPNGLSVFFDTSEGLVPQDTDGLPDVYDARLGEGFPVSGAQRRPCEGDACQGPLTSPAPLLVPGSVSQAPGDDFPPPAATVAPKPKQKSKLCQKGSVKKKNKCIKKAKAKKASRDRRTKS